MTIRTKNPATGEIVETFDPLSDAQLDARLQRAIETFRAYREVPFANRRAMLHAAARLLDEGKHGFARTMTTEMGKPLVASVQEVEKCARCCRFYADHGERMLAIEPAETDAARSFVAFQPLGVVLAIMPWNFPFWQVFRFAAPALMAGNVGLLKHASNVPRCALAIEDVFRRAGLPDGAFQSLLVGSDRVPAIIGDSRIAAVTLTGSIEAGRSVAGEAGRRIKKTVLELGGSDAFIVMPSCNLERTAAAAVQARIINNGQSCIAAKRFIVHEAVADQFERLFVERMRSLKVGDPMDEKIDVGPLATEQVLHDLDSQVRQSVDAGARVLCGGHRLDGPGWYYAPTVLTDIPAGTPAHDQELFGPVASVFRARSIDDAIRIANDTVFGLGASLWSEDEGERQTFIHRIEAGVAFVNAMVASDPRLPFGGIKESGFGRELAVQGIREFVNIKAVAIHESAPRAGSTE